MEVLTWQARNKRGLTLKQLEAATGIASGSPASGIHEPA